MKYIALAVLILPRAPKNLILSAKHPLVQSRPKEFSKLGWTTSILKLCFKVSLFEKYDNPFHPGIDLVRPGYWKLNAIFSNWVYIMLRLV